MAAAEFGRPDLLAGRYLLQDVLGQGGTGVVRRAWDTQLDRYVAVKLLHRTAPDPAARARFTAEGRTLAALNHPGLITLFDAATDGDEPYLVMELVDGRSLREECAGLGMDVGTVASVGARLGETLGYVHRQGIVHRDVKPGNVLLADNGQVKLADFGIAALVDGVTRADAGRSATNADAIRGTAAGTVLGTAAYLSPEQLRGELATAAGDVYSLGLVLIEALTGVPVFAGPSSTLAAARLITPSMVDERLPAPLRRLLLAMTAVEPEQRPTAHEVAAALRLLLTSQGPELLMSIGPDEPRTAAAAAAPGEAGPSAATLPIPLSPGPAPLWPDPPRTDAGDERVRYGTGARSWRSTRRILAAVAGVGVIITALALGPLQDSSQNPREGSPAVNAPEFGPAETGNAPEAAPKPAADDPLSLTNVKEDLQARARQVAEDAAQRAQDEARRVAQEAADAAARKAQQAVEDALGGLADRLGQ